MEMSRLKPLALAFSLCAVGPAMLLSPTVNAAAREKVTVPPGRSASPRQEGVISSTGMKALRHIARARADIHNKDVESARHELGQTVKLLDSIQHSVTAAGVRDRMRLAQRQLENEVPQQVLPDLVPIYTSLDELLDVMPTDVARRHLDQVRADLKSGDRKQASEALDATAGSLAYTEIDLPLGRTRQLVTQAMTDLDSKAADQADAALKTAEDSVVYLSFAFQQPLFTAKSLIWRVVQDVDNGNKVAARSDLHSAIGYLELASKSDQQATREAANEILAQAGQLQVDLGGEADAGSRVHQLWEHTRALAERSLEYLSTGWSRYRADTPLKSELIEAKLHIAYAKIDVFTGQEPGRAEDELAAARRFLDKAADVAGKQQTGQDYPGKITALRKAVTGLATSPDSDRVAQYDVLQQQLRDMIRSL